MNDKILYQETQRFKSKWIYLFILGLFALFLWGIIQQIFYKIPWGNNPTSDFGLIMFSLIPFGLFLLFFLAKLEVKITKKELFYQFKPFHFNQKKINWETVAKAEVVKYNPLKDYSGWGIKIGRKGKAYNVSGNLGLELTIKNQTRKILFGTLKPEELKKIIEELF